MPEISTSRPLAEAVATISRKIPVGAALTSREWELVPAEIKQRAMLSARVASEALLAEMQTRLKNRIELTKKDGRTMDRGVFIEEMRKEVQLSGYKRGDAKRGSLQDLKSSRRLGLIFDMNVAQVQGYAKWKMDMDAGVLNASPCYELIRGAAKVEIRNWPQVWQDAGGKFYGEPGPDYPDAPGRMLARKTDPIWRWISRFKTPWPPFDWGSGMELKNIRRRESDQLGLTDSREVLVPLAQPFNQGHTLSIKGVPESGRESLRSAFGDSIRFDGDRVQMQREASPETYEQSKQTIETSLRGRAREQYLQASGELDRLRRNDDGAEVGFQGEVGSSIAAIYLAQASAVSVGRKGLFHDTMALADAEAFFAATRGFPPQVATHYQDGHMLMWRRDLTDLRADELLSEMHASRGGLRMGYGLDEPAFNSPHVLVRIFQAPKQEGDVPLVGFHAPIESWQTFADARARDISDAWEVETETEWELIR